MKILVIGGTRYFGKRLVNLLIQEGHDVYVISRGNAGINFGNPVTQLKADRTKRAQLEEAVRGLTFDVVVDQVCMTGQEAREAIDIFRTKVKYYLLTSTMAVYEEKGNLTEEDFYPSTYISENNGTYAAGKRDAEKEYFRQSHFAAAFARFPVVLGPDDYTERLLNQVQRIKNGLPIYYPNLNAKFSFISSQDAARSLHWLINSKHTGAFNFSSQDTITLKDLVHMVEKETGRKAALADISCDETHSPFGIKNDWYMNVQKAKSLGFTTQDLTVWLQDLIRAYL